MHVLSDLRDKISSNHGVYLLMDVGLAALNSKSHF